MTILVPGTDWQRHGGWGPDNALFQYAETLGGPVFFFHWPGGNSNAARLEAAEKLRELIAGHAFASGESLNIIAHSHGGNVVLAASHLGLAHPIDLLIALNKPARHARMYTPGANIKTFYNLSARRGWLHDWLQWFGSDKIWRYAADKHAVNHTFNTSASPLKPHAALIWDDDLREHWWQWFLSHRRP